MSPILRECSQGEQAHRFPTQIRNVCSRGQANSKEWKVRLKYYAKSQASQLNYKRMRVRVVDLGISSYGMKVRRVSLLYSSWILSSGWLKKIR